MPWSALFLALLLPGLVLAGRPLSTEDASTLDDKACQLESWIDRTRGDVTHAFLVPACSYFDTEFQLGAARTREAGRSFTSATFFQAKRAFRSVDDGARGIGLVAGLARALDREDKFDWGDPYFIVPVSLGLGENSRDPLVRAGGRYTLLDKFDIDLTYVTRSGGEKEDRYWSLGFHWETDPFLP